MQKGVIVVKLITAVSDTEIKKQLIMRAFFLCFYVQGHVRSEEEPDSELKNKHELTYQVLAKEILNQENYMKDIIPLNPS